MLSPKSEIKDLKLVSGLFGTWPRRRLTRGIPQASDFKLRFEYLRHLASDGHTAQLFTRRKAFAPSPASPAGCRAAFALLERGANSAR